MLFVEFVVRQEVGNESQIESTLLDNLVLGAIFGWERRCAGKEKE